MASLWWAFGSMSARYELSEVSHSSLRCSRVRALRDEHQLTSIDDESLIVSQLCYLGREVLHQATTWLSYFML